ncbi:branched-chain amino acid transport system substrate-binding protein [Desulfobotulus alkaliphilus]|uniref:Branched-chain amino acid transport system substrate-binding protein n=1 Tax=Desulfobotulus alkaliphilus TaxID=622671 RepID=A0A562RT59_9BACT|nr:ABC transporter substrate-binding protein [Desulfobotulus alkaliphilus]TWI72261.1 branched-chain amino acid transport system substrate-binding protein [Desulfobotulus alkaliphilus]
MGAYMKSICLLMGLAACILLTGCEKPPVLIGFSGPLTGSYADLGVHGRNGAQLALEEINAQGGIAGRRLEMISRDDKGTAKGAIQADRELIEAKVVAIIGHMTSSQTLAAMPLIEEAEMVLFSPTTSTPELSGIKDFFFRIQPTTDTAATALARYAAQNMDLKRIASVSDMNNRAFAQPFHDAFSEEFTTHGKSIVLEKTISSPERPDWDALADELAEAAPDALLVVLSARDAAALTQAMHARQAVLPLLSANWAMTEELLTAGGRTVETMIFSGHAFSDKPTPKYEKFLENYHKRYGHWPSFAADYAYDTMGILGKALQKTGGRKKGLPEALLETRNYPGLRWPISIDAYGDVVSSIFITEVKDGQFRILRTILMEPKP